MLAQLQFNTFNGCMQAQELVVLSGAHTIGGKGFGDPTTFDNTYYKELLRKPWLDKSNEMASMIGRVIDPCLHCTQLMACGIECAGLSVRVHFLGGCAAVIDADSVVSPLLIPRRIFMCFAMWPSTISLAAVLIISLDVVMSRSASYNRDDDCCRPTIGPCTPGG